MTFEELKKLGKIYQPALYLEKSISYKSRRIIRNILAVILAGGFFVISIFSELTGGIVVGIFSLSFSFWLLIFLMDSFFYSYYFLGEETVLKESGFAKKISPISFELAQIVWSTDKKDATLGFLKSVCGIEIIMRLGITSKDISEFIYGGERTLVSTETLSWQDDKITIKDYAGEIFSKDESLAKFLFSKSIQRSDFVGATDWVFRTRNNQKKSERWWGRDRLGRIKGLAKDWAYGIAYSLDKYSVDIRDTSNYNSLDTRTNYRLKEISSLETTLSRSEEANVLIVAEKGGGAMNIIAHLIKKISDGSILSPLEHKRVAILDTNALIVATGDKNSFENELMQIMIQSIRARNIILVIPDLPSFITSARSLGSDPISILDPFLASSYLQVIAISDPVSFNQMIGVNAELSQRFEVLPIKQEDDLGLISLVEDKAFEIERKYGLFFTYGAIVEIISGAKRYFVNAVMPDKAFDILLEIAPMARKAKQFFVRKEDIADLIESKTGIPAGVIKTGEKDRLLNLEEILHKRIVGQNEAVNAISNAMRRARSGISNPNRPFGSFLFLGPTGVGKTETAKALAEVFFGSENKMLRLDMSEYNSREGLEKLIGSFESGVPGVLVSMLRNDPYGVLLLDEFEKTNKEVLDLFLQILDEGVFKDMMGKKVNAKNLIIIATSNAGSDIIWEIMRSRGNLIENKGAIMDKIISRGIFKPELLNRFDGTVLFHPLDVESLKKIANLMLQKLQKRLREKGIMFLITDNVIDFLVKEGNDPEFGARPLNRVIQEKIEKIIAEKIIRGDLKAGSEISLKEEELA